MQEIEIYRNGVLQVKIKPDNNSSQQKTIMGENILQLEFRVTSYVEFKINDYCEVFGETYKILQLPGVTKVGRFEFKYNMKMHHEGSDIAKVQFLFLGSDNSLREPEFSLMGNAQTFMDLILANVGRVVSGFSLGTVISTDYKNLTFSNDNCLSALGKIAEAFKTEWWIIGKVLHLDKKSTDTGITFRHGKAKGLHDIQRVPNSNNSIITRIYPYGSEKNLPSDYGSKKLRLTQISQYSITNLTATVVDNGNGTSNFTFNWTSPAAAGQTAVTVRRRLTGSSGGWIDSTGSPNAPVVLTVPTGNYEWIFISHPSGYQTPAVIIGPSGLSTPALTGFPFPYLESNVALYGVIEQTHIFEDIYPHRTGTVTSVDATDIYKFFDTGLDFNINDQLLPGLSAKVVFNTGQLSGYQFEIKNYNNTTKEITILKNSQETALEIPSALLKPAIGDKYVLIDIRMPDSYIEAAEMLLLQKANELLSRVSIPQYTYTVNIDPRFIRSNSYSLKVGDEVWITDSDLQINKKIRVVSVIRNVVEEYNYQVQLSDTVNQGTITVINNSLASAQAGIGNLQNQLQNSAIFNGKVVGDLTFEQGTAILPDMPETASMTGFETVVREISSGKLYRKV